MNWFRKYYENRRHFVCPEYNQRFILSFWEWLWVPHLDMWRCRYVRCPYCKERHWLTAEKVID